MWEDDDGDEILVRGAEKKEALREDTFRSKNRKVFSRRQVVAIPKKGSFFRNLEASAIESHTRRLESKGHGLA